MGITAAVSLKKRLKGHTWPSSLLVNDRRTNWIKSLAAVDVVPEIEVLETCATVEEMYAAEDFWIEQLRSLGCNLVNTQTGGKGWRGPRGPMSAEHKLAIKNGSIGKRKVPRTQQHTLNNASAQSRGSFVDSNGNLYSSVAEAVLKTGLARTTIQTILSKKRNSAFGLTFKYKEKAV